MRDLLFVSGNAHKFAEVQAVLAPEVSLSRADFRFVEDSELSIEEVAVEKSKQAFAEFKCPLLVEDTGVFFEAYPGFPGPLAKRVYNAIGPEGLLKLLEGKSRRAWFETVVVYTDGKTTKAFSGKTYGVIAMEKGAPNERFNFGYERLFIPDGFSTHMSAFSLEEKNAISHRAKAAKAFKEWFLAQK